MKGLEEKLEGLKDKFQQPVPEHGTITTEKKMAKKVDKKAEKEESNGKADAKAKKNGKAAKADKDEDSNDGMITLADLAGEAKISGAAARRKIRAAELERDGRWAWKDGSKSLKTARKALGLDA